MYDNEQQHRPAAYRPAKPLLPAALLLALGATSACKKAEHPAATNGTVTLDARTMGNATGRVLPAPPPESPAAGSAQLHKAIAFAQTGRAAQLAPLLSAPLQAELAKQGGAAFLEQYKGTQVEFGQAGQPTGPAGGQSFTQKLTLHLGGGKTRTATVTLRQVPASGSAVNWLVDAVRLDPAKP